MPECGLLQECKKITLQGVCCKARGLLILKRQVFRGYLHQSVSFLFLSKKFRAVTH